ncbi:MAG: glycosyltransferase family 39 protein, partial [Opitutales bacterium]|nr:glycosyltransferase family 39 protein [Opitutales bacterium]
MNHPCVPSNGLSRNWVIILLGLLMTLHFSVLSSLVEFGYASPDADGYFTQARLIAEEGKFGFEAGSPVQYFAAHWIEIEEGKFMSRYPYGFPLLLAMVWKLFGVHAAFVVNPLFATATVWMVYLLSRKFVSKPLSLVIAFLFAINPTFNSFTLMYFSHTAAVLTLVLGMYLFVLWVEKGHWWLGFLAGLILGSLPSIRYAEVSAGLGIGVFLIGTMILRPERRRSGLLVGLGAFVPVIMLLIFNHVNFGSALKTAYSLTGEQSLSLGYLPKNWAKYFEGLMTKGVGLFFVPGLLGLTAMTINPKQRLAGLSFLMISLSAVLVYSCYYFGSAGGVGGGGNVRFLIPIFPLVWIGAGYFLENIRSEKLVWIGTAFLIVLQASFWIPDTVMSLAMGHEGAKRSEELIEWLDENVPE